MVGGSRIRVLVTADEKVREEEFGGVKLAKVFELAAAVLAVTTGKFGNGVEEDIVQKKKKKEEEDRLSQKKVKTSKQNSEHDRKVTAVVSVRLSERVKHNVSSCCGLYTAFLPLTLFDSHSISLFLLFTVCVKSLCEKARQRQNRRRWLVSRPDDGQGQKPLTGQSCCDGGFCCNVPQG